MKSERNGIGREKCVRKIETEGRRHIKVNERMRWSGVGGLGMRRAGDRVDPG